MTEENNGSIWEKDNCYPLSKTNLSNAKELFETTHWINLRPLSCKENNSKKAKIYKHLDLLW